MQLYEVIVRDRLGSAPRSILILSEQPLSLGQHALKSMCNLYVEDPEWASDWDEYVESVSVAHIRMNFTTGDEQIAMMKVLKTLGQ